MSRLQSTMLICLCICPLGYYSRGGDCVLDITRIVWFGRIWLVFMLILRYGHVQSCTRLCRWCQFMYDYWWCWYGILWWNTLHTDIHYFTQTFTDRNVWSVEWDMCGTPRCRSNDRKDSVYCQCDIVRQLYCIGVDVVNHVGSEWQRLGGADNAMLLKEASLVR